MPSLNVRTVTILLNLFSIVLMKTNQTHQTNSSKQNSLRQELSEETINISTITTTNKTKRTTITTTTTTTTTSSSTSTKKPSTTSTTSVCHPSESNIDCCTYLSKCGYGKGHCKFDDDCLGDLVCGQSNCGSQYSNQMNCCTYPSTTTTKSSTTTTKSTTKVNQNCG